VTFAVDVVFCVPTLEAGSTAGQVLRKPVAQWNSLQQAGSLCAVVFFITLLIESQYD